jgi:hypothetical protein
MGDIPSYYLENEFNRKVLRTKITTWDAINDSILNFEP